MEQALRQPDIADVFERVLVPAIFERYARDLIERARPFGPSDRILDLGCGTGIVSRVLRERLGGGTPISGVDISAPMIAKARTLAPDLDWHEGNAMALPFADRSFDVVLAQQVLQFVPDRGTAVREIRRVLAPGGRVIASTWRPRALQPLHDTLGRAAERHFGAPNDKRFALDGDELRTLFAEGGFLDVRAGTTSLTEHWAEVSPQTIRLTVAAAGFDLASLTDVERERRMAATITDTVQALAPFAVAGGFAAPSITNLVFGRVP